jgi:hypothetical protein
MLVGKSMKTPFRDTPQSFATYVLAALGSIGLIGWGSSHGAPALIACIAGAAVLVVALLWVSVLLAERHDNNH